MGNHYTRFSTANADTRAERGILVSNVIGFDGCVFDGEIWICLTLERMSGAKRNDDILAMAVLAVLTDEMFVWQHGVGDFITRTWTLASLPLFLTANP